MSRPPNQETLYRKLYSTSIGLHKDIKEYGTCKDCKNWYSELEENVCLKIEIEGPKAFYPYLKYICTGPDFGCVHFKKQQKPGV